MTPKTRRILEGFQIVGLLLLMGLLFPLFAIPALILNCVAAIWKGRGD